MGFWGFGDRDHRANVREPIRLWATSTRWRPATMKRAPADRDDGRVRDRRPRPAGPAHPRQVEAGLAGGDGRWSAAAATPCGSTADRTDLVAAMTIGENGIDVDFSGTSSISAQALRRAGLLHRGLCLVQREVIIAPMPDNEGSLSVIITAQLDPERAQSAGRGPPRRRPDAARRDVRLMRGRCRT